MSDYLKAVLKARVYDVAVETPLERAQRLSVRMDNTVLFKREDLQPVFSFKIRGACNKLMNLAASELERGVICSSAGNHAQGVALAARKLGVRAVVVMPKATPRIKIEAVNGYGAETILYGDDYDAAYEHASQIAVERGLSFVHPFDDPDVIAGQGTIGMEILRQHNAPPDAIFVPVGGGGLISGIATYTKSLFPDIRVIGVEPKDCASMHAAFRAGAPVTLDRVGIFADGVAVRRVGDETFRLCREYVDDILLVGTDELCAAIQDIFEDTRTIVEPAGALAVAGMKCYVESTGARNQSLVTINCGANLNFDRLRYIAERAALGENREALLAVEIPEQRGSFLQFCSALGARNITEFNYRYSSPETAHIFVGVELGGGADEATGVLNQLQMAGYEPVDLSGNEFAKLHVRYLVGGPAPGLSDERVYRFEFPERPGALLKFLEAVGSRWNISLFHYRNHGSDYGRVLAGIQVPDDDYQEFSRHLEDLGYPFRDETDNPAYRMFLT